jgi:hypothetical protein
MYLAHNNQFIYQGEIWQQSQCLSNENSTVKLISDQLINLGYQCRDSNQRIWCRDNKKVILCLVDDITTCSTETYLDLPYQFDRDTTVITDNYIGCPTQYRVIKLPNSFFGIYSYSSKYKTWSPDREFSFAVNRIDPRRLLTFLNLAKNTLLDLGYVNFNCESDSLNDFSKNFDLCWEKLDYRSKKIHKETYDILSTQMPMKNYNIDHDQVYVKSLLNIIVETYGSDNSIALSEKIFRCLLSPAPWAGYLGRYGVAYLESLGFDCLLDVVDHHCYDSLKEAEYKKLNFVEASLQSIHNIKNKNFNELAIRCQKAAMNNYNLLLSFKRQFEADMTIWKVKLLDQLT